LAFPATLSVDLSNEGVRWVTGRLYFGGTVFAQSGLPQATHPEFRAGLELRVGRPDDRSAQLVAAPPITPGPRGMGEVPPAADTHQAAGGPAQQDSGVLSALAQAAKRFGRGANRYGLGHSPAMRAPAAAAAIPSTQAEAAAATASPPATSSGPHAARRLHRGTVSYVLSYEALSQRQYHHDPDPLRRRQPVFVSGNGRWLTHHVVVMLVMNLDTERSTSNAIAGAVEYLDGRNQHGQLVEYDSVRTVALSISYYW
jgi:hypothetical protein